MPAFVLGKSLTENINNLRVALGSVAKPLSYADFAAVLVKRGASPKLNASTVFGWSKGSEPGVMLIAIMADLAGVPFEEFALGKGAKMRTVAQSPDGSVIVGVAEAADDEPIVDGELVAIPAPHPRRGLGASRPTKRRQGGR